MNKKLAIFAIVLIIVGTIGTIISGVASVPYFANAVSQIETKLNEETIVFNKEFNINNLDINIDASHVVIKKHDKKEIVVTKKGTQRINLYDIKNNADKLSISQNKYINKNYKEIKNINDISNFIINEIYSYRTNVITVYLPKNVDMNVLVKYGHLIVEDDVLLNELNFKTKTGNISLPSNIKQLNNLNIESENNVKLPISELIGIKNIKINSDYVNIYSDEQDIFIDNIELNIPNKIEIIQSNNEYTNVDIDVDVPVANNLVINGKSSSVELDLPIDKYKINLDLKSLQNIDFSELSNNNSIKNKDINKYQNTRELNSNINNNLNNLEKEYKVQVKSNYISIK